MQQSIDEKTFDYGNTFEHYNLRSYGHQRKRIGGNVKKEDRVCRYCGTVNSQLNYFGSIVRFRGTSHSFPEALGNKKVIDLDECDACDK
jgi:5-methylcytosine-specific restriction endonuclease McrA